MIIGVDGNEANIKNRVGIGEYNFELLLQFKKFQISNFKFQIYLKDRPDKSLPAQSENWQYRIVHPKKLWTQIGLPFDLFIHYPRPDIFFTPTHYAPRFCPVSTVISIMDLSYIYFPQMFKKTDLYQLKNWTSYSAKKAKKIFTISKASKDAIIKEYGVSEEKIVVTYPGIRKTSRTNPLKQDQISNMDKVREKYGVKKEYLLFVGTLQPRKNIIKLIEAFSKLLKDYEDMELVIVGKKGWMYEEILNTPGKYGIKDQVKFLEFVSNEELEVFYKNALCFVLPSLYEGFGLPVLEAMNYGCPVITSNVSSLPEAGGDAAVYCDPNDVNDIAAKIHQVLSNAKLRDAMIKKGYDQVKKFSWEKTARETLKVLEEVANK